MAPISQFVTLKRVLGPEVANRFNLFSCITVNVNPAPGYSTGEVQQAIEEVAAQMLPTGYGYEYGGMAREEANTGGSQTLFIYAVCILLIYLILACLYESFLVPWAVILSVAKWLTVHLTSTMYSIRWRSRRSTGYAQPAGSPCFGHTVLWPVAWHCADVRRCPIPNWL